MQTEDDDIITDLLRSHAALIAALREARDGEATADRHRAALGAVLRYLIASKVPWELHEPLLQLRGTLEDRAAGGGGKPMTETLVLATAAATVTALSDRGAKVKDAMRRVAAAARIDHEKLRHYRDNINRALVSDLALGCYNSYLTELRGLPDEQFETEAMARVDGLGNLLKAPVDLTNK